MATLPDDWGTYAPQEAWRIFSGRECAVYNECLVDYEDYVFFSQWMWHAVPDKHDKKLYFRRTVFTTHTACHSLFLHVAILHRAVGPPPSAEHIIGDHINGNSLDNRRANLEWETRSENAKNQRGKKFYQRSLQC